MADDPPPPTDDESPASRDAPRPAPPAGPGERGPWGRLRRRTGTWLGAPGTRRRVLSRNALWNWGVFVTNALVVYFLSPFVVGQLGTEAYGIWAIVLTLTGYFGFADFGIRPAIVHYVARHDARGEHDALNRFVNSAFGTLAAGGALIVAASIAAAPLLPRLFDVPAPHHDDAAAAVVITGVTLALTLPLNAFSGVLVGKQRFDLTCRTDLVTTGVRTVAVVVALSGGHGLVGLALAHLLAEVFEMAWKTYDAFRVEPRLRFAPRLANRTGVRALLAFGGLNVVVAVSMQLTYHTDAWVIGTAISLSAVTFFSFPAKLAFYTRSMLWAVGRVLTPAIGALEASPSTDRREVANLLTASARTMLFVAAPLLAYWMVLGGAFLEAWLGPAFRAHGDTTLTILAVGALAPVASFPMVAAHYGTNRMRSLAAFAAIEGGSNLMLSLALVGPLGIEGVALGTAAPAFVVHFGLMPWWIGREFGMRWTRFTARVWIVPVVAGAATVALLGWIVAPGASHGWGVLVGGGVLALAIYLAIASICERVAIRAGWLPRPALRAGGETA